ncbi:hypothetical protein [Streptomyces sp. NPDC048606]|uniref:hypothetical protein n=1 Tax=Streptomyces sp. NPDC048606 TaxID=3154726 RepID=UPI00344AB35B
MPAPDGTPTVTPNGTDPRLVAEAHALLRDVVGLDPTGIEATFRTWNAGRLDLLPTAEAPTQVPHLSAELLAAARLLPGPARTELHPEDAARFAVQVEQALYASTVILRASGRDAAGLLADEDLVRVLGEAQGSWRTVVAAAARAGVPTPCLATALASYDALRAGRPPAPLHFGTRTDGRTDGDGALPTPGAADRAEPSGA